MFRSTSSLVAVIALTACQTTTSPNPTPTPTGAPATASNGYATQSSSFTEPGVTVTMTVPQNRSQQGGVNFVETIDIELTATNDPDVFNAVFDGLPVTLVRDPDGTGNTGHLGGNANSLEYNLYTNWRSSGGGLELLWINTFGNTTAGWDAYSGAAPFGFNSSSQDVAARSGSATYTGYGDITLIRDDDSDWTNANANASLTADFDADTIAGQLDVFSSSPGTVSGVGIPNTTVLIDPAAINGNMFDINLTMQSADFALTSQTVTGSGQFYEAGAPSVGGSYSGTGVDANDGGLVFITGGFAAEE